MALKFGTATRLRHVNLCVIFYVHLQVLTRSQYKPLTYNFQMLQCVL
jgi:hypothetical protein